MKLSNLSFLALPLLAVAALPAVAGTVYLDDSNGNLWAGDPTTATFTLVGTSAAAAAFGGFTDISFDAGALYGLSPTGELYTIDATNGQILTDVGNTGISGSLVGLATDSSGNLWAGGNGDVYTIDPSVSALATPVGSGGNGYTTAGDLDFDGSGNLYLTSTTPTPDSLWLIDQGDGTGTNEGALPYSNVFGVAFDSANGIFYGYNSSGIQFDINTAAPTLSGSQVTFTGVTDDSDLLGAAYLASPEPSTWVMFAGGSVLLLVGAIRRRKLA
jgi:hypothetical protein